MISVYYGPLRWPGGFSPLGKLPSHPPGTTSRIYLAAERIRRSTSCFQEALRPRAFPPCRNMIGEARGIHVLWSDQADGHFRVAPHGGDLDGSLYIVSLAIIPDFSWFTRRRRDFAGVLPIVRSLSQRLAIDSSPQVLLVYEPGCLTFPGRSEVKPRPFECSSRISLFQGLCRTHTFSSHASCRMGLGSGFPHPR